MSTRERIMEAAKAMMQEGAERLSVRAVAARAGIGASTLRHYFPTQHDLLNSVLTSVYETAMPDERIRDTTVPPRDRLRECLWSIFDPITTPDEAKDVWVKMLESFAGSQVSQDMQAGYRVIIAQAERRVGAWLAILEEEGALAPGDNARRTHFLLTVVDGLSVERALPRSESYLEDAAATLALAVDAVFDGAGVRVRPPQRL